ncbi:MAG: CopG family transcriptional regulator [Deltaproteobacteria bacterium HGW-Deltaproteobacteria-4]|nr:MAG: CopG family transcriptional regulator [Deltaproteobacteria bacterium HGW-Deltaproteobacteria-4]
MKKEKKKPRKDHIISTRISGDELQRLEMKSRSSNKSISDLLREALHAIAPPETSYPNS